MWAQFRDEVHRLYTEKKVLKREVAEKVGLSTDEVDRIRAQRGEKMQLFH